MSYKHFGDYVASLSAYDERLALTIRPFIKIERLSFKELQKQAYQTAQYLSAAGVKPHDRVMVMSGNTPEWLVLFLGVQLIGATLVSVDASTSLTTATGFVDITKPALIFRGKYLHPELSQQATTHILDELYELIANFPGYAPEYRLSGNEAALIVFTSGTTAAPKGVVLTQKNILANIAGVQRAIAIDKDWRLLSVLPLSHMYELTCSLAVLSRGASIFYIPRVAPLTIAKALQDYQITTILAIPQLLVLFLERIKQGAAEEGKTKALAIAWKVAALLPFACRRLLFRSVHSRLGGHLKLVVTGGAPIPIDVASTWERMGVMLLQGYGLTETSPILTVNRLDRRRLDSPGLLLDNVQLRIAEDGEIQAKGPSIFSSYWHNPSATKAAFTDDGWFRTGDIGHLSSGWLKIQGRLKFAIVLSSGLKVFPEDVELAADNQPVFKAICVVGAKTTSEESVLAVVISDESDAKVAEAIEETNAQLESFQHISSWRRWPDADFPRTRLLKIDRRKVQDWANLGSNQPNDEALVVHGQDPLIDIIRLSLNRPAARIRATDRLADLGLDSLRRLTVVSLIEERLGITVAEEQVTQNIAVADLRKLLAEGGSTEPLKPRPSWPFWHWVRLLGNGLREVVIRALVRIWVKTTVEGHDNLTNLKLPAIFIFNHSDDFDGPVIYQALPHRIRKRLTVAAAEDVLSQHKILAFIVRLGYGGFGLSRHEPYIPSLEYIGQMIDRGWSVVLSPEGRVSPTGKLQPFRSGIGLLAVNLGVEVVPIKTIGLHGTVPLHAKWPKRRSKVTIRIGQPISFDAKQTYDEVTEKLHTIMENL